MVPQLTNTMSLINKSSKSIIYLPKFSLFVYDVLKPTLQIYHSETNNLFLQHTPRF